MGNLVRWMLCQRFGKVKGVKLYDQLMTGRLGQAIFSLDEALTDEAIAAATSAIFKVKRDNSLSQ